MAGEGPVVRRKHEREGLPNTTLLRNAGAGVFPKTIGVQFLRSMFGQLENSNSWNNINEDASHQSFLGNNE